jgi:hypothetical protein
MDQDAMTRTAPTATDSDVGGLAAGKLKSFVERIERLEEEKAARKAVKSAMKRATLACTCSVIDAVFGSPSTMMCGGGSTRPRCQANLHLQSRRLRACL